MMTLEVWIMKPGSPCRVDDGGNWLVNVYDSHGKILQWWNKSYENKAAPKSFWSDVLPPGVYVVQAHHASKSLVTDHAIVCSGCEGIACVRLYVPPKDKEDPSDGGGRPVPTCRIRIAGVQGKGQGPKTIEVHGSATRCKSVKVTVSCGRDSREVVVPVGAGGSWVATLDNRIGCRCGGRISVVATCTDHPDCKDANDALKIDCDRPETADEMNARIK